MAVYSHILLAVDFTPVTDITVVIWKQLSGGIFDLYEIIPGFILSSIAIILFSLMTREPEAEIVAEYARVKETITHRFPDNLSR
jgi:Na+/proline symporter